MPRFKDMNRTILRLGSQVLGDGDMKIGVGLSPNEYERDVGAPEIGQTGRVGSDFIRVLIGHLGEGRSRAWPLPEVVVDNRAKELLVAGFLCLGQAYLH